MLRRGSKEIAATVDAQGQIQASPSEPRPLRIVRYEFRKTARFPGNRAQSTGEELARLGKKHSGRLDADTVLTHAKSPRSPLHWAFTWDNAKAADEYRRYEARDLLSAVRVVYEDDSGEYAVPAHVSLSITRCDASGETTKERCYHGIESIMADDTLRSALFDQALREIQSWRQRYAALKAFGAVFEAIDGLAA